MIKIWGRKSSSNVQVVLWAAAELGIGYDRIDAGLSYGVVDTPAYLVENPNGTVPMIQDGDDTPLWESSAILRYLANSYGNELMWPADPAARAQVDKWMEWAKRHISPVSTIDHFNLGAETFSGTRRIHGRVTTAINH
ncbi:MAG: glutathione S-transferase N-terminal domain-containing protein, partial [Rhizobiaceae bacterium]|nr:glutathione S-transferase N-terminal domain-containing protein [Rhizobiaceae bacterium]